MTAHFQTTSKALRAILSAFLAATLLALVGCESSSIQYNKEGYASQFGVMGQGPDGKYHVFAETTEIHRHVDPTYVHGFEVVRKDRSRFMGHYRIRFPEPIEITPEIQQNYKVSEGGRVIESLPEIQWGLYSSPFWFSEGDPLGTYELTIFLDGDPYRTIHYEVIPFGNEEEIEF